MVMLAGLSFVQLMVMDAVLLWLSKNLKSLNNNQATILCNVKGLCRTFVPMCDSPVGGSWIPVHLGFIASFRTISFLALSYVAFMSLKIADVLVSNRVISLDKVLGFLRTPSFILAAVLHQCR
jgi:hypothetical protein